jgi:putative tricarboxylic transport membrane protein
LEILNYLYLGFGVALSPNNLVYCFLGVFFGTLTGVLPGLGSPAAIALLLPATFYMPPAGALIMIAGIYYGAQYGGSTTSILVNIPGEATSVVTCLDGYQMARKGRAGPALGMSAFGSFIGGTLSIIGVMLLGPFLARFAIRFGPPEYFALMFMATVALTFLSKGSKVKSFASALCGFFLGTVGIDYISGTPRFTFGNQTLLKGVDMVPVAMGLFGISEVFINIEQNFVSSRDVFKDKITNILPTRKDWVESIGPACRGSLIGFLLGILPGGGAVMASFTSYAIEKRLSRHPELFGTGVIAGVAGPETANNAATGGAMIPLLSLGIPTNAVMAMLLGAMMLHGIRPSPLLIQEHPQIFWGVITSMYVGNVMLLILNLPMIRLWVKILRIPPRILFPLILLFCVVGAYSAQDDPYDILMMLIFGVIGFFMQKAKFESILLIFALIIGPLMETNFRKTLLISRGSFGIFFTHPISAVLIGIGLLILILTFMPRVRRKAEGLSDDGV